MKHFDRLTLGMVIALGMTPAAHAQIVGGALNYMLQRPRVAKYYKHKHAFDHLFLDAGAGPNLLGSGDMKLGATGAMRIGDWISPEHGMRIGVDAGMMRIGGDKLKYTTLSLDYMLNVTAIATPGNNYRQHHAELYGIAGADYSFSRNNGNNANGYGVHIGARGQFAMSPFTYFYIEPRFGIMQDDVSQNATWHGFRPVGNILFGFGYRLPDATQSAVATHRHREPTGFADGLFLTAMAGPAFLANGHPSTWDDHIGMSAYAGIGKWLSASNGVRVGLGATKFRQPSGDRLKAVSVRADYLLNLNNLFGGTNPRRVFWTNLVLGGSYNWSTDRTHNARHTWGAGGGLQANLRLSRCLDFVLEPRVDFYNKRWAPAVDSYKSFDASASLMAGLVYTYHEASAHAMHVKEKAGAMHRGSIGVSGGLAVQLDDYSNWRSYMPVTRLSYTHWSTPLSGWRYSLQGMVSRRIGRSRYAQTTAGADWLTDLTALSYGCDNTRALAVRTVIGANLGAEYTRSVVHLASDIHAGVQAAFRLSPAVSLTIEPQLAYEFSKHYEGTRSRRLQPQTQIGLEFNLQRNHANADLKERPERPNFVMASIGTGLYTGTFNMAASNSRRFTFLSDAGFGHWFNHVSGIQGTIGNTVVQRSGKNGNENLTVVRADYMINMKSAITGEPTEDKLFQLTGLAGVTLGIGSQRNHDTRVAPGLHAAMQAGVRVSKSVELYVEPSATIFTKKIETAGAAHAAEGEVRLSIGTKYHF